MNILVTAKQRGSTNALAPVAKELLNRGHDVDIYATGNKTEAAGFKGLPYRRVQPWEDYAKLVKGYEAVLVGLSGHNTPDGYFLRAANEARIPSVAVQDQNSNYRGRLGENPSHLPTLLAVMNEDCIDTAKKELGSKMGEEAAKRCRVVGWAAFDHYPALREGFTEQQRAELLHQLGLNPDNKVYFHATQNIHPNSVSGQQDARPWIEKKDNFSYEMDVTKAVFEAASDLGLKLVVKPHSKEEDCERKYTKELAEKHGFVYLAPEVCGTKQLMLASYSVTAPRSSCLTEATLFDRNTGGMLPDEKGKNWSPACPAVVLDAIPHTFEWYGIKNVLELVTSTNKEIQEKLAEDRKHFSVDGKAAARVADLVEELLH